MIIMASKDIFTEDNVWKAVRVGICLILMVLFKVCGIFISVKIYQWYTRTFGPFNTDEEDVEIDDSDTEDLLDNDSEWEDETCFTPEVPNCNHNEIPTPMSENANVTKNDQLSDETIKALFKLSNPRSPASPKGDDEFIKDVDELLSQIRERKIKKDLAAQDLYSASANLDDSIKKNK